MRHYNPRAVLFCVLAVLAGLTTSCTNDTTNQDSSDNADGGSRDETTTSSSTSTTEAQPEADLNQLAAIWQETLDLATADAYTYPNFTREFDGTVTITDCTIYLPEIWDSNTHLHQATATPNQNGTWTITNLQRQTRHCVPAELAQGALNGYIAYVEAGREYWNPPDPNHPGIQATLTGELLDFMPERLAEAENVGEYFVDLDISYPEIVDVYSPDRFLISDCRDVDPDSGLYDSAGNQTGFTPGERDLYLVEMQRTSDGWRASSLDARFVDDCEHAPTPAGRPLI